MEVRLISVQFLIQQRQNVLQAEVLYRGTEVKQEKEKETRSKMTRAIKNQESEPEQTGPNVVHFVNITGLRSMCWVHCSKALW